MWNLEKRSPLEIFILILLFDKVSNVKIGEENNQDINFL